jgi:hypothetical protein
MTELVDNPPIAAVEDGGPPIPLELYAKPRDFTYEVCKAECSVVDDDTEGS